MHIRCTGMNKLLYRVMSFNGNTQYPACCPGHLDGENMVERHIRKIRTGGFFSPSKTVMYEVQYMHPVSGGDARSITMYSEAGKRIGKMEYERIGPECKIYKVTVDDWSTHAYAADFLAYLINEYRTGF